MATRRVLPTQPPPDTLIAGLRPGDESVGGRGIERRFGSQSIVRSDRDKPDGNECKAQRRIPIDVCSIEPYCVRTKTVSLLSPIAPTPNEIE